MDNVKVSCVDLDEFTIPPARFYVGKTEVLSDPTHFSTYLKFHERARLPVGADKNLHWAAYWDSRDGYGYSSQLVVEELMKRGWGIVPHWVENKSSIQKCENPAIRALAGRTDITPEIGVAYLLPPDLYILPADCKKIILYSMWETSVLPTDWKPLLDVADVIVAPSDFCVEVLRSTGTMTPVFKIPIAFNFDQFPYIDRLDWRLSPGGTFNVLFVGAPYHRKGIDCAINCFKGGFPDDPDVTFHMHLRSALGVSAETRKQINEWVGTDPRITVSWDSLTQNDVIEMYRKAHILLHPARGEGFGRTPVEAMSTGLPVAATDATGMTDFMQKEHSFPIPVDQWVPSLHPFYRSGKWAEPQLEEGHAILRYVKSHWEDAKERGRKASEYVKKYSTTNVAYRWEFLMSHLNNIELAKQEFSDKFEKMPCIADQKSVDSVFEE